MNHGPMIPTQGDGDELEPRPTSKAKSPVSIAKAKKAAEDAGMPIINVEGLKAMGVLGEFVKNTGAIRIGQSMLTFASANYDRVMTEFRDLLAKDAGKAAEDDFLRYNITRAYKEVIDSYSANAMRLVESAKLEPVQSDDTPKRQAGFAPPPIGLAITVNNGDGKPATVTVDQAESPKTPEPPPE